MRIVRGVTTLVQTFGDTLRRLPTEQNRCTADEAIVVCLDRALNANGRLIRAYTNGSPPSSELVHPGRDPLIFSDLMRTWFALTQGRPRSVLDYADAGMKDASHTSVAVQLAGQAAKAHARMGNRSDVRRALDQALDDVITSFSTSTSDR